MPSATLPPALNGTPTSPSAGAAGSSLPHAATGARRRGVAIGLVAGAVVVIVGLAVTVVVLATRPPSEQPAAGSDSRHVIATSPPPTVATTQPPITDAPSTGAPTTVPPVTYPPATLARSAPVDGSVPMDTWAVMLGSLDSESSAEQHLADLRGVAPRARILDSTTVGSLRDGYWVVYEGGYASADAALAGCRAIGFSHRDDCYAAYLSTNPADQDRRAYPD